MSRDFWYESIRESGRFINQYWGVDSEKRRAVPYQKTGYFFKNSLTFRKIRVNFSSALFGRLAQLVRASRLHRECQGFKSLIAHQSSSRLCRDFASASHERGQALAAARAFLLIDLSRWREILKHCPGSLLSAIYGLDRLDRPDGRCRKTP